MDWRGDVEELLANYNLESQDPANFIGRKRHSLGSTCDISRTQPWHRILEKANLLIYTNYNNLRSSETLSKPTTQSIAYRVVY